MTDRCPAGHDVAEGHSFWVQCGQPMAAENDTRQGPTTPSEVDGVHLAHPGTPNLSRFASTLNRKPWIPLAIVLGLVGIFVVMIVSMHGGVSNSGRGSGTATAADQQACEAFDRQQHEASLTNDSLTASFGALGGASSQSIIDAAQTYADWFQNSVLTPMTADELARAGSDGHRHRQAIYTACTDAGVFKSEPLAR